MKKVRLGVFETNSSSTHTIVIPRNGVKKVNYSKVYVATLGEYGWENRTHYDLLSYIYTAICCVYLDDYKQYTDKIEKVADKYGIKIEWEKPHLCHSYNDGKLNYCYLDNGSIDHSNELEQFLEDLFEDDNLLIDAIFDGYVHTGNDNDDYSEGWVDKEEANEDCYYYYKGN